jgi:hypothetical protein
VERTYSTNRSTPRTRPHAGELAATTNALKALVSGPRLVGSRRWFTTIRGRTSAYPGRCSACTRLSHMFCALLGGYSPFEEAVEAGFRAQAQRSQLCELLGQPGAGGVVFVVRIVCAYDTGRVPDVERSAPSDRGRWPRQAAGPARGRWPAGKSGLALVAGTRARRVVPEVDVGEPQQSIDLGLNGSKGVGFRIQEGTGVVESRRSFISRSPLFRSHSSSEERSISLAGAEGNRQGDLRPRPQSCRRSLGYRGELRPRGWWPAWRIRRTGRD